MEENDVKIDITKNTIVCGDNLEWLDNIPNSCVDLCYIDPPFYSGKERDIVWKNGTERRSYQDKFDGDIEYYAIPLNEKGRPSFWYNLGANKEQVNRARRAYNIRLKP